MFHRIGFSCGSFAVLCFVAVAGCGGSRSAVQDEGISVGGRLVQGGQPASMENYQESYNFYQLTFMPVGGGKGATADVAADGSFEVRGISPGKYRVGVVRIVTGDEASQEEWNAKHGVEKSSLEVDIAEGQEVTVDLDKLGTT